MPSNNKSNKTIESKSALLLLENGDIFWGTGIGAKKTAIGEICFNTSQTGYQEILTDPSYADQIINFTFPHIGIVGTNTLDTESSKIYANGCIINQDLGISSNWRSTKNLDFFFKKNKIPCISNIDTRKITRLLSTKGAMKGLIIHFGRKITNLNKYKKLIKDWPGLKNKDLAKKVTTNKIYQFNSSLWNIKKNNYEKTKNNLNFKHKVICIDYGIKRNILRSLNSFNLKVFVLPANSSYKKIKSYNPSGIFLSNGPGDPFATSNYTLPVLKKLIKDKIPIFGICLGHQILSLALGGKTKKMFQGHRGANHPVKNIKTNRVEITSQNHGFEVDTQSFNNNIFETHVSLFDGSNEGFEHKYLPIFGVQYHPESSPGPHDSRYLFEKFFNNIENYAKKN